jgi:hypothetical protein
METLLSGTRLFFVGIIGIERNSFFLNTQLGISLRITALAKTNYS